MVSCFNFNFKTVVKFAGTPRDNASIIKNMSFFFFLPQHAMHTSPTVYRDTVYHERHERNKKHLQYVYEYVRIFRIRSTRRAGRAHDVSSSHRNLP